MATKPTILLIHGAWHTLAAYEQLIAIFKSHGYPVVAPTLPSGADTTPPNPVAADISLFSSTAQSLIDEGKEVVAVAHSYGGTIATEALSGKGVRERKGRGLPGGVRMIVFIAAFVLQEGRSLEMNAPIDIVPWAEYKVRFCEEYFATCTESVGRFESNSSGFRCGTRVLSGSFKGRAEEVAFYTG